MLTNRLPQQLLYPVFILGLGCNNRTIAVSQHSGDTTPVKQSVTNRPISQPLVTHIYTADPAAHLFNGRIYIYPSHDTATSTLENGNGDHFNMMDYHILSMDSVGAKVTDHGVGLDVKNIPWAGRQLWAPDAAFANGTYYLYFPAKDKQDVFRIGVATALQPEGPFVAEKEPINGSYSIDPCVFKDDDGKFYMYFGGIWGGQLQRWNNNKYDSAGKLRQKDEAAILPRVALLNAGMKGFEGPAKEIMLLGKDGKPFFEKDNDKRFFEGAWLHKYQGRYYFSYSSGDTHFINYAIGDNPYGPFTYAGVVLNPVKGWTNHHSIIKVNGKWFIFYHDTQLSGKTHLRNIKVAPLNYNPDGSIQTVNAYP
jgi:hypothetical protein